MAGPINPSMQAKANSFVAETNACIPEYLCFAQLSSESVIVHIENLMRQDGSGASGSHQGDPLECRLSHRRGREGDSYLSFRPLQVRTQQSCHN